MAEEYEFLVLRKIADPFLRPAERQQLGAFDACIGVLLRLAHVDQAKRIAAIELRFDLSGRKILIIWHFSLQVILHYLHYPALLLIFVQTTNTFPGEAGRGHPEGSRAPPHHRWWGFGGDAGYPLGVGPRPPPNPRQKIGNQCRDQ